VKPLLGQDKPKYRRSWPVGTVASMTKRRLGSALLRGTKRASRGVTLKPMTHNVIIVRLRAAMEHLDPPYCISGCMTSSDLSMVCQKGIH